MSDYSPPPSVHAPGLTVGVPTTAVPNPDIQISSNSTTGGAAALINSAISRVNASGGGIVYLVGGPSATLWTEATVIPMPLVSIYGDGVVISPINGAAFSPVIGNPYNTSSYITNVTYFGIAINSNSANTGFTSQSITLTSGTAFGGIGGGGTGWPSITPTNGTILLQLASGSLTSMVINGFTVSATGPWYLTYSDTAIATFTTATFTYIQNIDGWIANLHQNCSWIECTPWQGGAQATNGTAGGCAFFLDLPATSGGNGVKGNYIHVGLADNVSTYWCAGLRIGSNSGRCFDNYIALVNFRVGTLWRGIDLAGGADGNKFGTIHVSVREPYGVGMWVGSNGLPSGFDGGPTFAGCPDNNVDLLHVDATGSATNCVAILLGNYPGNATTVTTAPAFRCQGLRLDGTYADFQADVLDLRTYSGTPTPTGVYDFDVDNEVGVTRYRALSPRASLTASSSTGATLWAFKNATASGSAYPNPAALTFEISGWVNITTYSSGSVAFTLTYTDENSTLHSAEAVALISEGTTTLSTTAGAAGRFKILPIRIRAKASTNLGLAFTNGSASNVFDIEGCCDWLPM